MSKIILRAVITVLFASLLASYGQADEGDLLREVNDRAEIQALMWRYVRALDTLDEHAYADTFTEDGQFGVGANAEKGRAA